MRELLETYVGQILHGTACIDDIGLVNSKINGKPNIQPRFLLRNIILKTKYEEIPLDHAWVKCNESNLFQINNIISFSAKIYKYRKYKDKHQWKKENQHYTHKKMWEYGIEEIFHIQLIPTTIPLSSQIQILE